MASKEARRIDRETKKRELQKIIKSIRDAFRQKLIKIKGEGG